MTETESQALLILQTLAEISFSECNPITRSFEQLTTQPGIYAVRHRLDGLLYVGKAQDFRERFRGGHKALTWAWLKDYDHRDVAIATYPIDFMQWRSLSSELERIILQITEPPFNARIPIRE
jgi:excinuclease UvrABC nuclease subunit